MRIEQYTSDNKNIWDSFINLAKNPLFMHKRDFMEYHSDRFDDCSLMFFDAKENLIALLPANIKNNVLYSHQGLTYGGFITGCDMKQAKMLECFITLKMFMQDNGIKKFVYKAIPHIFHKYPSEEDLYALFVNNAKLTKVESSTAIFLPCAYKMSKGRKAQISRAKREGVVIEESTDFRTFIDLENSILSQKYNTKAVHTADELDLLYSIFPQNIKLYTANYHGKIIAGCLIFVYESTVHTQYLASDNNGREIGGLDLLIKTIIDKYKETKTYFDFGISTENCGKYLNEGLISQKEGFGGRTVNYLSWEMAL